MALKMLNLKLMLRNVLVLPHTHVLPSTNDF